MVSRPCTRRNARRTDFFVGLVSELLWFVFTFQISLIKEHLCWLKTQLVWLRVFGLIFKIALSTSPSNKELRNTFSIDVNIDRPIKNTRKYRLP